MQSSEFDKLLSNKWSALFEKDTKNEVISSNFDELEMRKLDSGFLVYYNPSYNKANIQEPDFFDGEENKDGQQDENIKLVYKEFDETKFNFNSAHPQSVLFYINLDNEEIITKEKEDQIDEK